MDALRTCVGDRVTIYPRGKKKNYVADFFQDGKHRRKSLLTPNKKVAIERATVLSFDLDTGVHRQTPPPVEFAAVIDQYLAVLTTNGRDPKTLGKYRGQLNSFRRFLAERGVSKLHAIKAVHFDAGRAGRTDVVKPGTVHDESILVKQLFKFARSRKLIGENPLVDIKLQEPPRVSKPGRAWISSTRSSRPPKASCGFGSWCWR